MLASLVLGVLTVRYGYVSKPSVGGADSEVWIC